MTTWLKINRYFSKLITTLSIPLEESVLLNSDVFNLNILDNNINDQLDIVDYLEEGLNAKDFTQNEFVSYEITDRVPTEVLILGINLDYSEYTEQCEFSNLFWILINKLFTEKIDKSLEAFVLSGRSFRFQIVFNYHDSSEVLGNTWLDPTLQEYISNQYPRNSVLNENLVFSNYSIIKNGQIRSDTFPIVSPLFEFLPSNNLNLISNIYNNYLVRILPNKNLSENDKELLIPYTKILPRFGSSANIPLQYLIDPYLERIPSRESKLNWPLRVDKYLEDVANIKTLDILIWS